MTGSDFCENGVWKVIARNIENALMGQAGQRVKQEGVWTRTLPPILRAPDRYQLNAETQRTQRNRQITKEVFLSASVSASLRLCVQFQPAIRCTMLIVLVLLIALAPSARAELEAPVVQRTAV